MTTRTDLVNEIAAIEWRTANGYLEADCGAYRLFVSRVGNMYRWSVCTAHGSAWLPVSKSVHYEPTPEQAVSECETAYREVLCQA